MCLVVLASRPPLALDLISGQMRSHSLIAAALAALGVVSAYHPRTINHKAEFTRGDADGDGFLDFQELDKLLHLINQEASSRGMIEGVPERFFAAGDKDGDKKLTFSEYHYTYKELFAEAFEELRKYIDEHDGAAHLPKTAAQRSEL